MSGELPPRRFVKLLRGAPLHRKFQRLGRVLEVSRFEAFGVTAALWDWTDENRADGDLSDLDAQDITDSIGASDRFEPDELIDAWVSVGLLDRDDDGNLWVHGWTDEGRSGADHETRVDKAQKAAHERWHVKKRTFRPDTCFRCRILLDGASSPVPEGASPGTPDVDADADADGPESLIEKEGEHARENGNGNADTVRPASVYSAYDQRPFVRDEVHRGS